MRRKRPGAWEWFKRLNPFQQRQQVSGMHVVEKMCPECKCRMPHSKVANSETAMWVCQGCARTSW